MAKTKEDTILPILLAYKKTINRYSHARGAEKMVIGNVILYISERTINFFNIPKYTGIVPLTGVRQSFERKYADKTTTTVKSHSYARTGCRIFVRKVKIIYKIDYYRINFPWFFDISMIRDSLFLLLKKNKEQRRFQVLPSQDKRDIFIGNKDMVKVWIPSDGKLVAAQNTKDAHLSDVTIVGHSKRCKQSKI